MASLGIRCGTSPASDGFFRSLRRHSAGLPSSSSSLTTPRRRGASIVSSAAPAEIRSVPRKQRRGRSGGGPPVGHEKLDQWMRESVVDIVNNLREGPLLVQVYDGSGDGSPTLKTEKAAPEVWDIVRGNWEQGRTPLPEGIIFVEEIGPGEDPVGDGSVDGENKITKAWGVIVQGKGAESGPACYLLKTSRVGSGTGLSCTHFCLVRVQSFSESVQSQLTNCWLLQGQ